MQRIFEKCDSTGGGRLLEKEMMRFAVLTGFEGSAKDWTKEYQLLCSDRGIDDSAGLNLGDLTSFINDESDTGQFCSDEDLEATLDGLCSTARKGK